MPRSQEKSVSGNIERLAKTHPEFPPKQRVAVAFSEARRAGAGVPKKPNTMFGRLHQAMRGK